MTGKQNNSIIEIKPNELVQYKNKFKSIAIYKEEQYESTVELINENYKEQVLTLTTSSDDGDANKLHITASLAKNPKSTVSYKWKVFGVDGITDLVNTSNFEESDNKLTIINQWDIKKFVTIQAFAYGDGVYIASSDILTVYEKDANLISAITADFSKDHVVIPEGVIDSASIQTLTTTTVTVYRGEDNITSLCKYIWSTKDGSVTNLINSNQEGAGGNVNGIKEFTNSIDELKVIIEVPKTTTLEGSITLEKTMSISRGGNAVYSIIPSIGVINTTRLNIEQDYTFTMQQLTSATGATTLTALPTGHSLAWHYINNNGVAIGEKTPIGSPTSGVWTFKYNPNFEKAAGFSIVLSDAQGDIVDSEQITFIQNGLDYTGLILAASSQVFSTSDPDTATITLTAQLYGDLVGETVSWYFGDNSTPEADAVGQNPYVLSISKLDKTTFLKIRAEAGSGKYSDTITIYKLNDAITAFFTNELMTFSADALGMVGSQNNPVAFTSNVKVFQGTTDVTNKITNISLTSTNSLSNVVITPAYSTESNPNTPPSVTISAKGTNFGTSEIISGKFSFTVTVDGVGDIPLDLSWIKIPAANGINNIEEYYQATATNKSPNPYSDVDKKIIDTKWKTIIIDAGQTTEKPYLWNFERIKKDNGDILRDTDVSLLSSSPRTIVSTTEYYTTNTTGIIPAGATYNDDDTEQTGNDAPKIDVTVWKTVEPTLAQGQYLYNFEVVRYAAVDADNKNLYAWTEPVQMGYAGKDGDKGATPYIGEDDYWYINGVSLGIKAKGEDGVDGTTPTVSINNDGYWVINGTTTDVSAQATNYTNLLLSASSQTFINNPNNNDPITPPSITLTAHLYGDLKNKSVTWYQGNTSITTESTSENIYTNGNQLIVKPGAFGAAKSLTFEARAKINDSDTNYYDDEFTVYLLTEGLNGTPGGKGDTGDPAYSAFLTDQSWSFSADKDGYISAGVTKTTTVKIFKGTTEITTGVGITKVEGGLNNTDYGLFAYSNTSPTLTFTSKNSNLDSSNSQDGQVTITATADGKTFTLGLSWDKTNTGDDAYSISLNKELAILECDPLGNYNSIELQSISKVKATVMHGSADISDNQEITYQWVPEAGIINSTYGREIFFRRIDADTATATLTVKKEGKPLGTKTFTVTKNKQIPGETIYLFPSITSITKTGDEYSLDSFTIQAMKKVGSNPPEQLTGYWYNVTVDDTPETMWYLLDGKETIELGNSGYKPNKRLYIKLYPNENHNEHELVDAKTISIIPEALAEYVLYNSNTALTIQDMTTQKPPLLLNYADYLTISEDANGWYRTQTSDSVWQSKKSAYPSTQPDVEWGAPMRISGVLTNFTDLYNTLKTKAADNYDGLYKWEDTIDGKTYQRIGVDASVIRAGAIKIGTSDVKAYNKFYADMDPNESVYIAGWAVNSGSLTNSDNKVSLTPNGTSAPINKTAIDGVVINANNKFAVTKDGAVYATAGKIGNVSIDNIASTKINPNLFIGSTNDDYWTSSVDKDKFGGTNGEYWITWNGTTGGGAERFIYHQPFGVVIGKTYTLSFDAKKTDNLSSSEIFILQNDWKGSNYVLNWTGFSGQLTQEYKRFSHTFTVPDYSGNMADCDLRFDHNGSTNGEDATLWVRNIKLEEGTEATAWSLAPGDVATTAQLNVLSESISAKVENSYTGTSIDWAMKDDEFKVTAKTEGKTGGITVDKDGLVVEGNIKAHGGKIGGWNIGENSLTSGDKAGDKKSFYMATGDFSAKVADRNATDWRLTIGENFGVNNNGELFATAGKIGNMTISQINDLPGADSQNLVLKSDTEHSGTDYYFYNYNFTNNAIFTEGAKYTISFEFIAADNVSILGFYNSSDNGLDRLCTIGLKEGVTKYSKTFTWKNSTAETGNTHIEIYTFDSNGNGALGKTSTIKNFKLERGQVATPWRLADEEMLNKSVDKAYSWDFSPTKGIKMWKGSQTGGTPLLKVDERGLQIEGSGTFSGTISASFGDIAGWKIDSGSLTNSDNDVSLTPNGTSAPINKTAIDGVVINANNKFAVTKDGEVYATAGKIGEVVIGDIASTEAVGKAKNEAVDEVKKLGYQTKDEVTQITKDTVSTETIIAKNLTAGYIQSNNYKLGTVTESALVFTPIGDHYKVGLKESKYISSEVLIPERYNDKPVTELDVESFANGKNIIKKLAIPASITTHPFGLLKDYTEIVELHAPIHRDFIINPANNQSYQPYFVQYFGSYDYNINWIPNNPPTKLQTVYLSGRPGVDTIYKSYFDTEYWGDQGLLYHQITVYLTPSITTISDASIQYYDCFKEFFYYQDSQYEGSQSYISKTNESYVYPASITGFRITSKESEPMINSQNFKVTQDGTVYANAGRIGNVDINNIGVIAQTIKSPNYKVTNTTIDGFQITSEEGQPMINSKDFQVTQEGVIHSTAGKIAGWDIDNEGIYKKVDNNLMVYMSSGSDSYASIANKGEMSPVRFLAGTIKTVEVEEAITSTTQTFTYSPSDCIKILSANYMVINTGGGCNLTGIGTNTLTASWSGAVSAGGTLKITYTYESPNFAVLEDGSLHASAVDITGTIHAGDGGNIGMFNIVNGNLDSPYVKINSTQVHFPLSGSLQLGDNDVVMGRWTENGIDQTNIVTNGSLPFVIKNRGGAGIKFIADGGTQTSTNTLTITLKTGKSDDLFVGNSYYNECFWFEYSFSNGGSLVPLNRSINYNIVYSGKNKVSSGHIELQIPANSTSGVCVVTDLGGSNYYTMHWDKNHSKPNYIYMDTVGFTNVDSITFSCSGKWSITKDMWKNLGVLGNETFTSSSDVNNILYSLGHLFPETKNSLFLGNGSRPWGSLTVQNAVVTSSDKRLKNSIQQMTEPYEKFYDELKPVMYKYNNGTSDRLHSGFIAQQVEESLNLANINTKDFAGICIDDSEGTPYFLRYSEFISLNTWQIQKLKACVKQAEETIELQDAYIKKLEERIEKLEQKLL